MMGWASLPSEVLVHSPEVNTAETGHVPRKRMKAASELKDAVNTAVVHWTPLNDLVGMTIGDGVSEGDCTQLTGLKAVPFDIGCFEG